MQREKLHQLLEKFHAGQCTNAELEALQQWYDGLGETPQTPHWDVMDEVYLRDKYADFQQRSSLRPVKSRYRIWKRVTAAAAILTGIILLSRYLHPLSVKEAPPAVTGIHSSAGKAPGPGEAVTYDRHLILPDSSVVLLRAGSTLQLAPSFNQTDRLLTLQGEAYFDVKHNARKPFMIRCANVCTYVLGTAFNIKADAASRRVVVTVASGKVRVEKENKTMAVLTQNQELVCGAQQPAAASNVNVAPTVEWMAKDLMFNETSLETICNRLSARYQMQFVFSRQINKEKRVTITDAFYGTESLNDILDIVCTTLGYAYSVTGNTVTITTL
ncbi:FecR family protein [Chitinophaga sp. HK235]|uniref:FecR family protein n=1 Tax=Chitinophaga sp. HK235 TaxID=2952571 RepID=UPI001BA570FC|nr:FecR family protein [Chitinophaga sp. HK235]